MSAATIFLIVGLPGAGKTERAKALAAGHSALRLTPDEWMIPLFGDPQPAGKRDIVEGRLIWLALEALRLGTNVVLDFGLWGRDERSSLRWLARSVGASSEIIYLPVDRATQIERIQDRWRRTPHQTFGITEADVDRWRSQFEAPDAAELADEEIADPPPAWSDWAAWAAERWPTASGDGT
jgi:predicted kinase